MICIPVVLLLQTEDRWKLFLELSSSMEIDGFEWFKSDLNVVVLRLGRVALSTI